MTVGSIGSGLVWLAAACFLLSLVALVLRREKWQGALFTAGCLSLVATFVALGALMVGHQFQYGYVWRHSDLNTPLGYRIAAIWSGQEGSFLLWAVASAIFGALVAPRMRHYRPVFTVASAVFLLGLSLILCFESPYKIQLVDGLTLRPPDGNGLNPTLLNPWVQIHPPTIFLGFGSLTTLYSLAIAALWTGDTRTWIGLIRPWLNLTVTLLGVGLAMGGFWAYETLGWGGFWAWDPVENTSFVPWVWSLALLHGFYVQSTTGQAQRANLVLAGLSFLSFSYGTFLTRSGFLGDTSVHSFAQMERHALQILVAMMLVSVVAFLGIYAWKRPRLADPPSGPGWTRRRAYVWGVGLLLALGMMAAIGMSVPIVSLALKGKQSTVPETLYNQVTIWAFVPLVLFVGLGPILKWRREAGKEFFERITYPLTASLFLLAGLILWVNTLPAEFRLESDAKTTGLGGLAVPSKSLVFFLAWICFFAICTNLARILQSLKRGRSSIPAFASHIGVITAMLGLIASRGLERKAEFSLQGNKPARAFRYTVKLAGRSATDLFVPENKTFLDFSEMNGQRFRAKPVLYYVPPKEAGAEPMPVTRPDIQNHGLYDLYVTLGQMIFDVGEPMSLAPGQTMLVEESGIKIKYLRFERVGEAGKMGTTFWGHLLVQVPGHADSQAKVGMTLTGQGPDHHLAEIGPYKVALKQMDAAKKGITLELFYKQPVYPVEVYFKPLTILVWVGTGIMTLGGLAAAWMRRRPPSEPNDGTNGGPEPSAEGLSS